MFKKILIAVLLVTTLVAQAGTWTRHNMFTGSKIQGIIDTDNCVYTVINNALMRFDKTTLETQPLSNDGRLSESLVDKIFYNHTDRYLLVTYLNSNIDLIDSLGQVTNLPILSNMVYPGDKTINDVTFGNGRIYLSTSFGFVVVNGSTFEMEYYRNYGKSFRSMAITGQHIAALVGDTLYYCTKAHPETFSDFRPKVMVKNRQTNSANKPVTISSAFLHTLNDSSVLLRITSTNDSTYLKRITFMEQDSVDVMQYATRLAATNPFTSLQSTPTGFLLNVAATTKVYYTLSADGATFKAVNGKGNGIFSCCPTGNGTLWGIGANGLFDNATATTYYKPDNAITLILPYWAAYDHSNGNLYMTNTAVGPLLPKSADTGGAHAAALNAHVYDGTTWRYDGCVWGPNSPAAKKNSGGWQPYFSRTEPNTYYVGTWFSGMVKVQNDTVVAVYDEDNSTIIAPKSYYRCVKGYGQDSQGNLWMVESTDRSISQEYIKVMVLPADKQSLNDNVTADDWYCYDMPGTYGSTSSTFNSFALGRGDVKVFTPGNWGSRNNYLVFWRGAIDSEQEFKIHDQFTDQDGNSFKNNYYVMLASDSTGLVWVASSALYYLDPSTAFDEVLHVTRPVTSSGEYVLDGVSVEHIDVDTQNRKWVSTKSDGIYLLSADGTEVLQHFTTSNSPLPSNTVFSSCPMGNTGHVMIMTSMGVVEYDEENEIIEATDGYTVYPNPVRPDFTGLVTIQGVLSGQQVRVCDQQGNTVAEFTASASATWDACDSNGERVETGRYTIFVSQPDNSFTETPQASVYIIK